MIDWRGYEVLTFEQAIAELRIEPAKADEYSIVAAVDRNPKYPRTRDEWVRIMGPIPIADFYSECNSTDRDRQSLIFRAMNSYDFVSSVKSAQEAKKAIPRPNELLKVLRNELQRRVDNPFRCYFGSPVKIRAAHLIYGIPEVAGALIGSVGGKRASTQQMLYIVNKVMEQRGKKGRPPLSQEHEVYDVLREDFEWLTGKRPRWSNATGLEGDFIDFARAVYRTVGIAEPSERMLRPRRRSVR